MKKLTLILLTGFFFLAAGDIFAQKITSGSFAALKGQSVVNIQYDYSNLMIGKKTEKEYIEKGTIDRNKKKEGSGDAWAESWENDKTSRLQPTFERNLNGAISAINLDAKEDATDAKYTLIVHLTFIEPGFQSGVGPAKSATINLEVNLVETANPATILGTIVYDKIPSANMMGYDFDTGSRIESCFDRAGGNIGRVIVKAAK
jgi:hypothetical protein